MQRIYKFLISCNEIYLNHFKVKYFGNASERWQVTILQKLIPLANILKTIFIRAYPLSPKTAKISDVLF